MRARTRSNASVEIPASALTRERRLSAKSTSPRMAASVAAWTSSPRPASSARSSITSLRMRVESASRTTRKRAEVTRSSVACRSTLDVHALADYGYAAFCDSESSFDIAFAINTHGGAVEEYDVLIQHGSVHTRTLSDLYVVEQHRVGDGRSARSEGPWADHAALQVRAG